MIKWFKRNQESEKDKLVSDSPQISPDAPTVPPETDEGVSSKASRPGFLARFKQSLSKTRHQLGDGISRLLLGKKEIDATLLEELETLLLGADVGVDTTKKIIDQLSEGLLRKQLSDGEAVYAALKTHLQAILNASAAPPLTLETRDNNPFVILMIGVNGAGKTTTIGKLAKQYQQMGKKVMLAAGDTFRAAAIEQLQTWGERNGISVIAQHKGADSASVIFDALMAAKARGMDILIADTAGRLHTQQNLMDELKKVKRVLQKIDPEAPHETMLVLDASIGQNALNQARQFHEAIGVTGIAMTKLDGSAKGGILFAIADELKIPFRFIGIGEGLDDLRPFSAEQFVNTIFDNDRI
ncbi:signal recognition particle-docking protein FtsY [Legionella londiniensis]|uniref:Signal recognition particle receptor FtsY n=1 Tax=Legionella londiniensis TaxID=45068 RepID=A0A0W0VIE9_9GAMM|nr:signal recognition particle-docking protein FtsY [Legionella londiniensis]KTD19661.1 cell division membrane protein FtsY [Legionella londiniensis]STX92429.1 cell division membrane protein FtsY [Legionella londiniensis]